MIRDIVTIPYFLGFQFQHIMLNKDDERQEVTIPYFLGFQFQQYVFLL